MLLHPCAILAKGPPWIIAGLFSKVCTILGFIASLRITAKLPSAFKSLQVTGWFLLLYPIIILPSLLFKSLILVDKHSIAIISEATEISNPSTLDFILFSPESPTSTFLNSLSFKSTHLFHVTFWISSSFPK